MVVVVVVAGVVVVVVMMVAMVVLAVVMVMVLVVVMVVDVCWKDRSRRDILIFPSVFFRCHVCAVPLQLFWIFLITIVSVFSESVVATWNLCTKQLHGHCIANTGTRMMHLEPPLRTPKRCWVRSDLKKTLKRS